MTMQAKEVLMVMAMMGVFIHSGNAQLQGNCDSDYVYIAGNCYNFHQNHVSWPLAESTCDGENAQLASVLNLEQYNGLLDHINENYAGTYWTSGATRSGMWEWTATGGAIASNWWGRDQVPPATEDNCVYFCSHTLRYWDKSCNEALRFICQKEPINREVPAV